MTTSGGAQQGFAFIASKQEGETPNSHFLLSHRGFKLSPLFLFKYFVGASNIKWAKSYFI